MAGATAKHCIVIHGVSTFLSGEGRHLDYDQECFTRANVAYSRATDLTILACPLNMQGMPGALQVLAALLRGVQTIYTYDSNESPRSLALWTFESLRLRKLRHSSNRHCSPIQCGAALCRSVLQNTITARLGANASRKTPGSNLTR